MDREGIKALIKQLENNQKNLSRYQINFIKGAKRYFNKYDKLSEKQIETLVSISKGVMVDK